MQLRKQPQWNRHPSAEDVTQGTRCQAVTTHHSAHATTVNAQDVSTMRDASEFLTPAIQYVEHSIGTCLLRAMKAEAGCGATHTCATQHAGS